MFVNDICLKVNILFGKVVIKINSIENNAGQMSRKCPNKYFIIKYLNFYLFLEVDTTIFYCLLKVSRQRT